MIDVIKELKKNNVVIAMKTDTVYGLICRADDKAAVEKIYKIKNREKKKPISIFVKDINDIYDIIDDDIDDYRLDILNKYWPGALTVIFKKKKGVYDHLTCGCDTIGIRIPDDKDIIDILDKINTPLAETSCNISGEPPYIDASTIKTKLSDKIDFIVDGGIITNNVASTVISFVDKDIKILRQGDIVISG